MTLESIVLHSRSWWSWLDRRSSLARLGLMVHHAHRIDRAEVWLRRMLLGSTTPTVPLASRAS